jgi:hypothetical protein
MAQLEVCRTIKIPFFSLQRVLGALDDAEELAVHKGRVYILSSARAEKRIEKLTEALCETLREVAPVCPQEVSVRDHAICFLFLPLKDRRGY